MTPSGQTAGRQGGTSPRLEWGPKRRMGPEQAPRWCTPNQGAGCARGSHTERLGLYPGTGGTARGVLQEGEWGGQGQEEKWGLPGRRGLEQAHGGRAKHGEAVEKRADGCAAARGETLAADGAALAPGALTPLVLTHTSACFTWHPELQPKIARSFSMICDSRCQDAALPTWQHSGYRSTHTAVTVAPWAPLKGPEGSGPPRLTTYPPPGWATGQGVYIDGGFVVILRCVSSPRCRKDGPCGSPWVATRKRGNWET